MLTPPNYLKWIKGNDPEQITWAIEYFRKKTELLIIGIESANAELNKMDESRRKLLLNDMRNAWSAKTSRKRKTSGSAESKKSAFQVYLSSEAIKSISYNSKQLGITKTQYIEELLTNQVSRKNRHKEKLETYNSQHTKPTNNKTRKENTNCRNILNAVKKELGNPQQSIAASSNTYLELESSNQSDEIKSATPNSVDFGDL